MSFNWSNDIFLECYDSIKYQDQVDEHILKTISHDLNQILLTPEKSEASKNKLLDNKSLIEFSNGDKFRLNEHFIESSMKLSNELDLNELATAELLYHANSNTNNGLDFLDNGRSSFLKRFEYILNILGHLITSNSLNLVVTDYSKFQSNLIQSFNKIFKILTNLNDLINKYKVTDLLNESTMNSINFTKSALFSCHELLGLIMFNLSSSENYIQYFGNFDTFKTIMNHIKTLDDSDLLIVHYLPSLLHIINNLESLSESEVFNFHKLITTLLSSDYDKLEILNDVFDLSGSNLNIFEILVYFIFLVNFVPWCKQNKRFEKIDFTQGILKYIEICLNYGVLESLLRLTSETTTFSTFKKFELNNLCDFKFLLQKNLPNLSPIKFIPTIESNVSTAPLFNLDNYKVSDIYCQELLPQYFHIFFMNFIHNVAIVLTQLRDNEEDFLLSSINRRHIKDVEENRSRERQLDKQYSNDEYPSLDLDEIASRAELERFYLSCVYTYSDRPELCSLIWDDDEFHSDLLGFIMWGLSNNTSPLITATFCLLLGSLTSSGGNATKKVWESLVNNNANLKKNDYSKISIDSIIDSLNYYLTALNDNLETDLNDRLQNKQKRQEILFSNSINSGDSDADKIEIVLADDSIVFISGFLLLISSIVSNLSNDERSNDIRNNLFNRFKPIIVGFLKFDNLLMNAQLSIKSNDLPIISVNEANRVVLINSMLNLLESFSHGEDLRYKIWEILDKWMYHKLINDDLDNTTTTSIFNDSTSQQSTKLINKVHVSVKNAFSINLTSLSLVKNFTGLLKSLLKHPFSSKLTLPYPNDLGYGYRLNNSIGIWPYMEYLLLEVFQNSTKIEEESVKKSLQADVVGIIINSLEDVDWHLFNDLVPEMFRNPVDLNNFVNDGHFDLFIKLHHSIAIINYLFDSKSYLTLFGIILNENSDEDGSLLSDSLTIIKKMMLVQDVYKNLLPIVNGDMKENKAKTGTNTSLTVLGQSKAIYDKIYYPRNFNGGNIYEILLFNIPVVIKIGLLIENDGHRMSELAIDLLSEMSRYFYTQRDDNNLLIKNRLLTIYETSQESNKLKYSFINQFNNCNSLKIKSDLLKFIINDLDNSNNEPCVSHYLLGYEIKGNYLILNKNDDNLLKDLVDLLIISLEAINTIDFNNGINIVNLEAASILPFILNILVNLSKFELSSVITLDYLRNYPANIFEKLINNQPKIDLQTVWSKEKFNENLNIENSFTNSSVSFETFFDFFKQRILILQYLTIEFHSLSQQFSIYKKNQYLDSLLNGDKFLTGSHKILSFLDVLNFKFTGQSSDKFNNLNLDLLLKEVKQDKLNFQIVEDLKMFGIFENNENEELKSFLKNNILSNELKQFQLEYLHSWCQLIEVIINDGNLPKDKYQNFILEILSSILPKVNDYFESDIQFSEELISLCVLLLNQSEKDDLFIERLSSLFSTCVKGILSVNNTIELRSDLYIILNKFLQKSFRNDRLQNQLIGIIKRIDFKFIDTICNDSILSEGSIKITALILLESLIHLSANDSSNQQKFILDKMIKNNSLLLIIRSVKRIDEILINNDIDMSIVLYEITTFKSIINLLMRIGQIKVGASYLIQSELFSIIKKLNILLVDPDLGVTLNVDKINKFNLSLDSSDDDLSLFEVFVPIFQLVSTLLLSMGPNFKPSKIEGVNLLNHFNFLINNMIKRDILVSEKKLHYEPDSIESFGLNEIIKQIIVIKSIVNE